MTLRYTEKQEPKIQKLMLRLDENTAAKAFLEAPDYIETLITKNANQNFTIQKLEEENQILKEVLRSWFDFHNKITEYYKKR